MTMKRPYFPSVALPLAVLALLTACSNGDADEAVRQDDAVRPVTIHYRATAADDAGTTRATLNSSTQMIFESGDELEVTGDGISGTLTLSAASDGERHGDFEGDLTYTGGGSAPADDLDLSATLVGYGSSGTQTGLAATFAEAFRQYSLLQTETTSAYASRSFALKQQSTFVVFTITFEDGMTAGTTFDVTVGDDGNSSIATGTTTTASVSGDVVATFTLALPGGTTLTNGKATLTAGAAIHEFTFGGSSYTFAKNKYYTADRTVTGTGIEMTSDIGTWTPGVSDPDGSVQF